MGFTLDEQATYLRDKLRGLGATEVASDHRGKDGFRADISICAPGQIGTRKTEPVGSFWIPRTAMHRYESLGEEFTLNRDWEIHDRREGDCLI